MGKNCGEQLVECLTSEIKWTTKKATIIRVIACNQHPYIRSSLFCYVFAMASLSVSGDQSVFFLNGKFGIRL